MLTLMLGIDAKAARATWTVFLIVLTILLAYLAGRAILIFVVALFFAYMLSPLVDLADRFAPGKIPRTAALAVVYLLLIAVLLTAGGSLGGRLADEATNLANRMPELLKQQEQFTTRPWPAWIEPYHARIVETLRGQIDSAAEHIGPFLRKLGPGLASMLGSVGLAVIVPILAFFFLKDAHEIQRNLLGLFANDPRQPMVEELLRDLHFLLANYIRAIVILSLATFVFYFLYLQLTGVPYSALLAAIAAPLEFIPVIGPLIASVTIILVAGFSGYPHLLWIIIFLIVYRLFQDYVLQPYLMSSGVELHPLLVIFGALAGEGIGGIWGMFLSVPVLAALRVVVVTARKHAATRRLHAEIR